MSEGKQSAAPKLAWLPLAGSLVGILALYQADGRQSYESSYALFWLNLVFTSAVSLFITVLAGRSFVKGGHPGFLMMGCAMLVWGASAFLAGVGGHIGNHNITIHNIGVFCSGAFHLAAALVGSRGEIQSPSRRKQLAVGYVGAAALVGAVWLATVEGWLPIFFIQGQGGTPARNLILSAAIAMFTIAGALMWSRHLQSPNPLMMWYSIGLGLVGAGAMGLMLQSVHGSVLGWTSRSAQYLGGIYILIGATVARRQVGSWALRWPPPILEEVSFRRVMRRATMWPAVILLVFVLLLLGVINFLLDSARMVDHTEAVLAQISRVEKLAVDMESGIRGYRLTKEVVFLEPFQRANATFAAQVAALQDLVQHDPEQLKAVKGLWESQQQWAEFADEAQRSTQARAPVDVKGELRGKELMDALRARIARLQGHEQNLLAARSRTLARVRVFSFSGILLTALVLAPLLIANMRHGLEQLNTSYSKVLTSVELELEVRKTTEQALARAKGELERLNQTLERNVEERTAELKEALRELEAYSYSVAHDLRAPLRGMQGFAKLLAVDYGPQLDDNAREYLRRMGTSAERMDRLIQDVLSYSRIVSGEVRLEAMGVEELLNDIILTYPNLQPPHVEITISNPLPRVMGNVASLTQVFSNLLGNAAKFVAPGVRPKIHIKATLEGKFVRFWFEDNGIGIERLAQKRIFQLFGRINKPELYEGTGLGLAIVRKAVERMGGSVGVESELGKGSRFWVTLKRADL
ncbi:MAG TPA: CHASE3 domain-containing protein [Candidatus Saccharimonadales bacterium]|nr:CHASE3 domain-containing protein [Candidatus Saccharimonadales bacterium]